MFRIIFASIGSIVAFLASAIALNEFALKQFYSLSNDATSGVIFLGLFAGFFFFRSLYQRIVWDRAARYGQTLSLINEGFAAIHTLNRRDDTVTRDGIVAACEKLCGKLAQAFSTVTGTACCVTIKMVAIDAAGDEPKAIALCRSSDERSSSDSVSHPISKNTAFMEIFEHICAPRGKYFFCNNLPLRYRYENTSFQVYGEPDENPLARYWRWPLPYKSTIVVPICPDNRADRGGGTLIGFLCVDSNAPLAFRRSYDVDLMLGVSGGLYDVLCNVASRVQGNDTV